MFEIVFSNKANETFDSIQRQLLERWGVATAIKFEKRLVKVLQAISNAPLIYQSTEINPEVRKAFIHKIARYFTRSTRKR